MRRNENDARIAQDRIDKGIVRTVHDSNSVPGQEMPAGILGAPMRTIPTTHLQLGRNVAGMDPPAKPGRWPHEQQPAARSRCCCRNCGSVA